MVCGSLEQEGLRTIGVKCSGLRLSVRPRDPPPRVPPAPPLPLGVVCWVGSARTRAVFMTWADGRMRKRRKVLRVRW